LIQCALRTKNEHISAYSALGTDALFLYHDICGVALKAFTSDVVAAGQCGEDVYYIRYADGHVLLQGSGATYDYSDESTPKSVFYNMPEIKSVVVQEGITKLGNALRQTDITEIVIPTKVSVIEDYLL